MSDSSENAAIKLKFDTKFLSALVKGLFDGILKEIKAKQVHPVGK